MKIFLVKTGTPENMLKEFMANPLDFLYYQEDLVKYKIKTISNLIDEIQGLPKGIETFDEVFNKLSSNGKRRLSTILNQLKAMK